MKRYLPRLPIALCGLLLAATPALPQPRDVAVQAVEGVRGDKLAVIVGINEYEDPAVRDLNYAAEDARAVFEVLTDPERGAFLPGNVHLLTDSSPADHQPTRVNILRWLNVACRLAEPNDTVLFYFGGHGIPDYLLAQDTQLTLPQDTGVRTARVQEILEDCKARRQVVVYDCCHSGGVRVGAMAANTMASSLEDQLFGGGEGRVVLSSCSRDQVAWEWPERGHGVFTAYLLEAFDQGDSNGDGVVTVTEAGEYVMKGVKTWALRSGQVQQPRMKADVSGPIALALAPRGRPPAQATPAVPTPPAQTAPVPTEPAAHPWEHEGTHAGEEITGPDGGTYVWVPSGEFMMGSEDGGEDERPVHRVQITTGFWLGKCEVTNAQYQAFCAATGREFPSGSDQGADHPVVYVSWEDAQAYCKHYGLRLPTEAEWEYAARGRKGTKYPWGNEWDKSRCCNGENPGPGGRTCPVGSFPAGASWCGALDLTGNVWEWCGDWYSNRYYGESPAEDPQGPTAGDYRVLRGGSWHNSNGGTLRCAYRLSLHPPLRFNDLGGGFRGARTP